jgi:hypothetical protein
MAPLHCPPYHHHLVVGGKEDAAFEPRIIGFRIENIVPGRKDATHVLEAGGMTWQAPSHRGVPERSRGDRATMLTHRRISSM